MIDHKTIEKKLGYTFSNKNLLLVAFLHRSYGNEHSAYRGQSNERLEFLGDSVLSLIVADALYRRDGKREEGDLTLLRSAVVSQRALCEATQRLSLGQHLLMARGEEEGGGRDNPSLLANLYEAVLGAMYLDGELSVATTFVERTLLSGLPTIIAHGWVRDDKSILQERVQREQKRTPKYKLLATRGPDHHKIFTVGVYIDKTCVGTGTGRSKQEAEQSAASSALKTLDP